MKTLLFQSEHQSEKMEIWETDEETLLVAWAEMDNQPEEGGWISFKGEDKFLVVNGGFVG